MALPFLMMISIVTPPELLEKIVDKLKKSPWVPLCGENVIFDKNGQEWIDISFLFSYIRLTLNIKTIFQSLSSFFQRAGIDYALVGAFALKAYGYLRATEDVDFLVKGADQSRIIGYLKSLGYETIYRSPGYSNHVHPLPNLGRIDFIYVEGETADIILSETRPLLVLDGLSVPVVRPEHLIALKVFAMKNDPERSFREMADLQYLLKLPGLDLGEIKGYFEKYGQRDKYDELTKRGKKKPRS